MAKYTQAQRLGRHAEQMFGVFVAQQGWVWNPTAAGADFGVDGAVTIVDDTMQVQPLEFHVQVKAVKQVDVVDNGVSVSLPPIPADRWRLWQSHLLLTMVALWEEASGAFYYQWASDIEIPAGQATHRARIPKIQLLDAASAERIRKRVEAHRDVYRSLVLSREEIAKFLQVYDRLSDCLDLCVEFMAFLDLRDLLPIRALLDDDHGDTAPSPHLDEYSVSLPPSLSDSSGRSTIVALVIAVVLHELDNLVVEQEPSASGVVHPLVDALSNVSLRVREIEHRVNVTIGRPDPREEITGRVVLQSVPDTYVAAVQLGLLLRDLLREMRRLFFPPPPATRGALPITTRELAARNVMPEGAWIRHSGHSVVREAWDGFIRDYSP
ncbi:MAG: DUF4365 domain-containing protein [Actinomycetota bacterium]|nr:DUF4365 domain-containing protein [Actinomycetota bacterium]